MDGGVIVGIIIAAIEFAANAALSSYQISSERDISSRATRVQAFYDAVEARFQITIDQLNNYLERLGFTLNQILTARRGSARLSRASQIYRDFVSKYPGQVNLINKTKNEIQNEINNLSAKEAEDIAKVQSKKKVSNQDIHKNIDKSVDQINTALTDAGLTEVEDKTGNKTRTHVNTSNMQLELGDELKNNEIMDTVADYNQNKHKYDYHGFRGPGGTTLI